LTRRSIPDSCAGGTSQKPKPGYLIKFVDDETGHVFYFLAPAALSSPTGSFYHAALSTAGTLKKLYRAYRELTPEEELVVDSLEFLP
jgi:hypothetical protein